MEKEPKQSVKDQVSDKIRNFDANEKVERVKEFTQTNTIDAIWYVVLLVGLIVALVNFHLGLGIIGVVTGIYFTSEITSIIYGLEGIVNRLGVFRCLVLLGAGIAVFFSAPMFFIAAAVAAVIKDFLNKQGGSKRVVESTTEEASGEEE